MPLSDLVRNLNAPPRVAPGQPVPSGLEEPFVAADGRVFLHYANLRLESLFQPVLDAASGRLHGHAATLQAFGLSRQVPLLPEAVFVLPGTDAEFVYLDRIVRTLHALNYLTQPQRGNLLLQVHARHVLSVPARHGLAFEEILRPCGLFPEQITLEIDSEGIDDLAHLKRAVASYRSRGYGIALGRFGRSRIELGLLRDLQPDIVRLDRQLLAGPPQRLSGLVDTLHRLPLHVLADGLGAAAAQAIGIDLVQPPRGKRLLHADGRPGVRNAA